MQAGLGFDRKLYVGSPIINLPTKLHQLWHSLPTGSKAYLAGGCVRDALLGHPVHDYDVEIYGIPMESLLNHLNRHGRTDTVGKSFGVIKWSPCPGEIYDIALPRQEIKTKGGHRGFSVHADPHLSPETACARRDYTINAMLYCPLEHQLIDLYGGQKDLEKRLLRHTSVAFVEDPLRVMRGMQMAGRFGLSPHPETVSLCRSMHSSFTSLPKERLWEEWKKWATQSTHPSMGLSFLNETGWLSHHSSLNQMIGIPQDPQWHPEGDVWEHTLLVCDAVVGAKSWQGGLSCEDRLTIMMACLLHDTGKVTTTKTIIKEGIQRIVSPGHAQVSSRLSKVFLDQIGAPLWLTQRVRPLVQEHMMHLQQPTERAVRRLSKRLEPESIKHLCHLMLADAKGRGLASQANPSHVIALRKTAEKLEVTHGAPKPLVQGKQLISMGYPPGKEMGRLLTKVYDQQIEQGWNQRQSALAWLFKAYPPPKEISS